MPKTITLYNGMIAEYQKIGPAFILKADWSGQVTEFALVTEPDDENGINAVKYTFEQLYKDKERWEKEIWDKFREKLLPLINRDASDVKIGADDLDGLLVPVNIALIYTGGVHLFEPEGTRIEVAYKVAASNDDEDDEDNTYYLSGTLEKGLDEFTVNDIPLIPGLNLLPYTLSTGEQISYNPLLGAYSEEVDYLDDTVEVYWEPNEDLSDANKAFELFEKVREKAALFDKMARNRIRAELQVKIVELRKEYDDPELDVDDLMEDLLLTIMVYDCKGTFEFAYETLEPDLRITTRGSYNMPFTTVMIEDISDEDF